MLNAFRVCVDTIWKAVQGMTTETCQSAYMCHGQAMLNSGSQQPAANVAKRYLVVHLPPVPMNPNSTRTNREKSRLRNERVLYLDRAIKVPPIWGVAVLGFTRLQLGGLAQRGSRDGLWNVPCL